MSLPPNIRLEGTSEPSRNDLFFPRCVRHTAASHSQDLLDLPLIALVAPRARCTVEPYSKAGGLDEDNNCSYSARGGRLGRVAACASVPVAP